ncbi:MAG: hypothetical protein AMJ78_06310 [Omnitrophica WOR_2 bacterium SM23_29]|nr:MAG: hypothetical protein AMJ78_06310 [Omnitrophica WOR_2 bacterium SM23_29]
MYGLKNLFILTLLIAPVLLSGCATTYNPATSKEEFIMIGTQEEVAIGQQVARQIEHRFRLSDDLAQIQRVNKVGNRIASVCDRRDLQYYFKAIKNKDINALSTPGGYVYVNTGLLDKATDDELAAVVAHEIGHIAARHAVKAMQADMAYSVIAGLIFSRVGSREIQRGANIAMNLIMLGYSREDEFEADKLGVKYTYYAGFDPNGMITFLEKLKQEEREHPWDKSLVYLRSHPLYSDRISKAKAEIAFLKYVTTQPPAQSAAKTKLCPKCGAEYEEWFKFCVKDGTELQNKK